MAFLQKTALILNMFVVCTSVLLVLEVNVCSGLYNIHVYSFFSRQDSKVHLAKCTFSGSYEGDVATLMRPEKL